MTTTSAFAPDAAPLEIGMLLYPGMTLLDLVGPQSALGMHGRTHLFWKTLDPVMSDTNVAIVPTATFADKPAALDVLFVPGGFGTMAAMEDEKTIAFLAEQGRDARYITSVCSGALLLGMAGLLEGYRAATHSVCGKPDNPTRPTPTRPARPGCSTPATRAGARRWRGSDRFNELRNFAISRIGCTYA